MDSFCGVFDTELSNVKSGLKEANTELSNLHLELLEAFETKNLNSAKNLVEKLDHLNIIYDVKNNKRPVLLGYFVINACDNDEWFEFYRSELVEGKINVHLDIGFKGTALHYASQQRNKRVLELLLGFGADINALSTFADEMPLLIALKDNDHDLANFLFHSDAKIPYGSELEHEVIENCNGCKYTKETLEVLKNHSSNQNNYLLQIVSQTIENSHFKENVTLPIESESDSNPSLDSPNSNRYLLTTDSNIEPSFVMVSKSVTFANIKEILNSAAEDKNYYNLDKLVDNIKICHNQVIKLDVESIKNFCINQLHFNLNDRSDHKHIFSNILLQYNWSETEYVCRYPVKDLILFGIIANDDLTKRYQTIIFSQQNIFLLALLVSSECYKKVFAQKFCNKLYLTLKQQKIELTTTVIDFYGIVALQTNEEFLKTILTEYVLKDLEELLLFKLHNDPYGVIETATITKNKNFLQAIFNWLEDNISNPSKPRVLINCIVTCLETSVSHEITLMVDYLCKEYNKKKPKAIRESYTAAYADHRVIDTIKKQLLKSIDAQSTRNIYKLLLQTAVMNENIEFVDKVLNLLVNNTTLFCETLTIIIDTVGNKKSLIISHVYTNFLLEPCNSKTYDIYLRYRKVCTAHHTN